MVTPIKKVHEIFVYLDDCKLFVNFYLTFRYTIIKKQPTTPILSPSSNKMEKIVFNLFISLRISLVIS